MPCNLESRSMRTQPAAWGRSPFLVLLGIGLLALISSPGCDQSGSGKEGAGGSAGGGELLRIAVIPKGTTHVFWKSIEAGARKAGKELGVEIKWQGPLKEDDREGQRKVIETFITSNVNGIV